MSNIAHLMTGAQKVIEEALGIQAGERVTVAIDFRPAGFHT